MIHALTLSPFAYELYTNINTHRSTKKPQLVKVSAGKFNIYEGLPMPILPRL